MAEDIKDRAEADGHDADHSSVLDALKSKAQSVIDAITSGDLSRLTHTGLFAVHLQPPNPDGPSQDPAAQAGRALAALIAPHLQGHDQ